MKGERQRVERKRTSGISSIKSSQAHFMHSHKLLALKMLLGTSTTISVVRLRPASQCDDFKFDYCSLCRNKSLNQIFSSQ